MAQWLHLYFMRARLPLCVCVCACVRVPALIPGCFLCVTQKVLDLLCECARVCVCINAHIALRSIVMLICGRLHQVSQDTINLSRQTALEIDMHVFE